MFELESKQPDEVVLTVKDRVLKFDLANGEIDADLAVGKIQGPGSLRLARRRFGDCDAEWADGVCGEGGECAAGADWRCGRGDYAG